jgi:hypothetical protein
MTLSRIDEHLSVAASGLDEAGADAADGVGMFGDGGVTDIFAGAGIASQGRRRGGARRGVGGGEPFPHGDGQSRRELPGGCA